LQSGGFFEDLFLGSLKTIQIFSLYNKDHYCWRMVIVMIYEDCQIFKLFAIPPSERSKDTLDRLVELTSDLKFFQKLSKNVRLQRACLKAVTLLSFKQDEVICSYGEQGNCTYIIMQGTLAVLVPIWFSGLRSFKSLCSNIEEEAIDQALQSENTQDSTSCKTALTKELKLREVGSIGPGESFGEISILINKPRSATIKAKTDCTLLRLTKDEYKHIMQRINHQQLQKRVAFLSSIGIFSNWTRESLLKLTYFMKPVTYRQGALVYIEGSQSQEVYIVRSGEFKFYKCLRQQLPQSPRRLSPVKLHTEIKLTKELFGIDDAIEGKSREMTCECSSPTGKLYVLTMKDFINQIQKSDSWNYLVKVHIQQKTWREEKLERISRAETQFKRFEVPALPIPINETPRSSRQVRTDRCNRRPSKLCISPSFSDLPQMNSIAPACQREVSLASKTLKPYASVKSLKRALKCLLTPKNEFKWRHKPIQCISPPKLKNASKLPPNFFASGKHAVTKKYLNSPTILGTDQSSPVKKRP
jgi:CRP-like cAMP-binding protein